MRLSGIFFMVVACIASAVDAKSPTASRGRPAGSSQVSPPAAQPGRPAGPSQVSQSAAQPGRPAGRSAAAPRRTLPKPGGPRAIHPGAPASNPNPTVANPCAPKICYKFKKLQNFTTYEEWEIGSGNWLKVKTVPFNESSDEFQFYTSLENTGMAPSVPALVLVNLGGSLFAYREQMNTLASRIKTEATKLVSNLQKLHGENNGRNVSDAEVKQLQEQVLAMKSSYANAYKRLSDEAATLRKSFHKRWTITVYNYLGGKYQRTPANQNPTPPDLSGKPDLSVVNVPSFNVYTTSYINFGFGPALEITSRLAKEVKQPIVDKVYFLNYLNGRYDIWLPVNQAVNPFP